MIVVNMGNYEGIQRNFIGKTNKTEKRTNKTKQ